MDISRTYQKMCICKEIQKKWKIEEGDYFFKKSSSEVYFYFCGHEGWPFAEAQRRFYAWLPRQDQLQAMIEHIKYLYGFYLRVAGWTGQLFNREEKLIFEVGELQSFEQIWLCFFMWIKHQKAWNGEEWKRAKA